MLQKTRLLDPPVSTATLLAACLGGAAAWAATGVFSIVTFVVVAMLGLVAQMGLSRLKPYLPWIFLPLLVVLVYWAQAIRLDWMVVWPTLIMVTMWAWHLPGLARLGNRGYAIPYGIFWIGIIVEGIPIWCLVCLLAAPLARRMIKAVDKTIFDEWATVMGIFLVAGYLIKGLIR